MTKRRRRRRRAGRFGDAIQERFHENILRAVREGERARDTVNCKSALSQFVQAKMYLGAAAEDLMHRTPTLDMRQALSSATRELKTVQERLETKCLVKT
jgi:hypothetical protein